MQPAHFLTPAELLMVEMAQQSGEIPYTREPAVIRGVMHTQLSVARYYGGIKFGSSHYTYFPAGDELIRDDVLKHVTRWRKEAAKAAKAAGKAAQGGLL